MTNPSRPPATDHRLAGHGPQRVPCVFPDPQQVPQERERNVGVGQNVRRGRCWVGVWPALLGPRPPRRVGEAIVGTADRRLLHVIVTAERDWFRCRKFVRRSVEWSGVKMRFCAARTVQPARQAALPSVRGARRTIDRQECAALRNRSETTFRTVVEQQSEHQRGADPVARFPEMLSAILSSGRGNFAGADDREPGIPPAPEAWRWEEREHRSGTGEAPVTTGAGRRSVRSWARNCASIRTARPRRCRNWHATKGRPTRSLSRP